MLIGTLAASLPRNALANRPKITEQEVLSVMKKHLDF